MGDWLITITGVGSHHNKGNTSDADAMAREFVEQMKAVGQRVRTATFGYNNGADLEDITPHDLPPATMHNIDRQR